MSIFKNYRQKIVAILEQMQKDNLLSKEIVIPFFSVEPPREEKYGDLSTNIAMILAKSAGMKPMVLAELVLPHIQQLEGVSKAEIAGAGFINFFLEPSQWHGEITRLMHQKDAYGRSELGKNKCVNIEYVSANPTGPLHVGHVRGAVFGDALANLLAYVGYRIIKEYYINDAGSQIDMLAGSVYVRYLQALGQDVAVGEGLYPGEYLIPLGQDLFTIYGSDIATWEQSKRHAFLCDYAVEKMMAMIKEDLALLNIHHDVFTSERKMVQSGAVDKALAFLENKGLVYEGVLEAPKGKPVDDWEERPQTLFKSKDYGDDTDRPLKKSDGSYTYFATDIAYHFDKFGRKADLLVNVWGADHGGYVKRIHAAIKAMSNNKAELQVKLCQIVHLFKEGKPYKMSKRAGSFVTLRDVLDEVGGDVVRFMMLTRKNEAPLDFDFSKATEQSKDNPVFYVQYANARIHSVLRLAVTECDLDVLGQGVDADLSCLTDSLEKQIMQKIGQYPRLIEQAAEAAEPHRLAFYLSELAGMFHALWNKGKEDKSLRFVIKEDMDKTKARLMLIFAVSLIIESALKILGVKAIREM